MASGPKITSAVLEIRTDTGSFMSDVGKVEQRSQGLAITFKNLGQYFDSFGKNVEDAGKAIEKTTRSNESLGTSFGKLVGSMLTAQAILTAVRTGFEAMTGGIIASITAAGDAEKTHTQLVAALRAQGTSIPSVISAYAGYATALQKTTIYQDDAIEGAAALLVQIGNVMPRDMEKALKATTNLASGLGIDLESAVRMVAKAAEGNTTALRKAGVVLDEATAKSGDFGKILDVVNSKFGGQAAALASTYEGRIKQIGNTWNNVEESIGRVITQNATLLEAMNQINKSIDDNTGELNDNAGANDLVSTAVIGSVKALALLVEAGGFVIQEFIAVYKVIGDVVQALEMLNLAAAKIERLKVSSDVFGLNPETSKRLQQIDSDIASMTKSIEARGKALTAADASQEGIKKKAQEYSKILNDLAASLESTRGQTVKLKDVTDGSADAWSRHTKAIHVETEEEKKFAAAMKEINAVGVGWRGTLDTIDGSVVEAIKYYIQAGVSLDKLAAAYHLTEAQVKAVESALKSEIETTKILDKAREEAGKTVVAWIAKEATATRAYLDDRIKAYSDGLEAARAAENEMALLGVSGAMRDQRALEQKEQAELASLAHLRNAYPEIYAQIAAEIHRKFEMIAHDGALAVQDIIDVAHKLGLTTKEDVATNLELARNNYNALRASGVVDLNELQKAWRTLQDAETAANGGVKSWGQTLGDTLMKVPGLVAQAFASGAGLSGALQGVTSIFGSAGIGKLFGNMAKGLTGFMKGLVPVIGEALGSLVGPLVQWVAGLFDHVPSNLKNLARGYGVTLSDEVMKGIRADMDALHLSQQAATIFNASKLFPTVDATNFSQALNITRDAFSMLATKQLTAAQAGKVLQDMWPNLAKAGTSAIGAINKGLVELIRLDDAAGTHSQAIADFLKEQATTGASSFSDSLSVTGDAYKKLADDQQKLADQDKSRNSEETQAIAKIIDLEAKLKNETNSDKRAALQDDINKLIDKGADAYAKYKEIADDIIVQQGIIDATTVKSQASADAMAAALAGEFDQLLDSGVSFADAIKAVGPGIDALGTELLNTGLQGSAAFSALKGEVDLYNDSIAGPALQAINALGKGIVSLGNMGKLDQKTFAGLGSQISDTFDALVKQGYDGGAVLIAMKDPLQALWEEQQQFGLSLDDATQALVDEAVAAGEVGEKHKSSSDQMIDALNHIDEDLTAIAKLFGVTIPDAAAAGFAKIPKKIDIDIDQHMNTDGSPYDPADFAPGGKYYYAANVTPDNQSPFADWGGAQAAGGAFRVTRPTLFLAGEAGPETAIFSGANQPTPTGKTVVLQENWTMSLEPNVIDGADLDSFLEKKLMPRMVETIEDRRRGYTSRIAKALATV